MDLARRMLPFSEDVYSIIVAGAGSWSGKKIRQQYVLVGLGNGGEGGGNPTNRPTKIFVQTELNQAKIGRQFGSVRTKAKNRATMGRGNRRSLKGG